MHLSVLGVPDSSGSYAIGQEQAPAALREAGLLDALRAEGHEVVDLGDVPGRAWRPDRAHPFAQNLDAVVDSVTAVAERSEAVLRGEGRLLVLGGSCTIAVGVCAGMQRAGLEPQLAYVDRHLDLNVPSSIPDGTLDWMGVAHALGVDGAERSLVDAGAAGASLTGATLAYLGVDLTRTTTFEREQVDALAILVVEQPALVADPAAAASRARSALRPGAFAIHVDVDVLDFIDAPIAENTDTRNSGPTVEQLGAAIATLWSDPACVALSIGELNPAHAAADPEALPRFVAAIASALRESETGSRPPLV